ncbi:MAG: chorismate synthase [Acetatifactor sp.]|nr:chorismate synthase [Acetatifactor sp.]
MAGSTYGNNFKITTWGESHGKAVGVVIDGCPAGLKLSESDIQPFLDRRKPGTNALSTPRSEDDEVEILSGVFEGKTTGTPISMMIRNKTQISADYSEISSKYRPGHADYSFDSKYGFRDYRGGGRSSGRETAARVCAGAVAMLILKELGIKVYAYTKAIGPVVLDEKDINLNLLYKTPSMMPNTEADEKACDYVEKLKDEQDSTGGIIECVVTGLPAGIGEPVFDKLDASVSKAVMSIGAVKAVEIGDGIKVSSARGSENNDGFFMDNGKVCKITNHSGGTLGGMSDSSPLLIRAHVKPTPSIFKKQQTVTSTHTDTTIEIKGRHDPVIVPRAVVVTESMVAITVLDLMMSNMSARLDRMIDFYKN